MQSAILDYGKLWRKYNCFFNKNYKQKKKKVARNYRLKVKRLKQWKLYGPHMDLDLNKSFKKEINIFEYWIFDMKKLL